ncbi:MULTISPECIES: MFS transporter [Nonomuraea]|uniref:MFS transporter n=1 Tax=Nonomuraea TaxID=83681 RepID=UPI001C5CFD72|nr:MFS transporter [Nonomuraea ceibae]
MNRSFGFLLSSATLSNLADGVLKVGAPLLAVSFTRSPAQVALVGAATTLPWLLFALPAGALADRLDRRRIMVTANALRAGVLVAAGALAVLGLMNLWVMLAAVLLASVAEVLADTSAQSVLPMAVEPQALTRANGRLQSAQMIGNEFAGSPLAGVLVTLLPAAVFGGPGLLYAAAGLLLLGMRGSYQPAGARRPMAGEIAEALRWLWSQRFLRALALTAGTLNFATAAYWGVFVLWLVGEESRFGLEPSGYGLMLTVFAAGAAAGALVSERISGVLGEGRTLIGMWLLNTLLHLVPLFVPVTWLLYPTALLWGISSAVSNVLVISTRQRLIPTELLGRVNAAYRLIGMGGMPVGAALGGVLGEAAGLPAVFGGSVVLSLVAVGLLWRVVRGRISAPLTSQATIPDISRSR